MAKGALLLDDVQYGFDPIMGTMLDCQWLHTEVGDYWYEAVFARGPRAAARKFMILPATPGIGWMRWTTAKSVSKDVYQESDGGKWVRYDANGR